MSNVALSFTEKVQAYCPEADPGMPALSLAGALVAHILVGLFATWSLGNELIFIAWAFIILPAIVYNRLYLETVEKRRHFLTIWRRAALALTAVILFLTPDLARDVFVENKTGSQIIMERGGR